MDDRLIKASQKGDIDVLYELIGADTEVLRRIDEIMFVDTPLHIAASGGKTCFAMEMMNLMPSFARKLNKSGLSPMHLAMLNGHLELVLLFLEVDCDLVRVKGKEGLTPLHFAVKNGHIDLLAKFLVVCPKSIEDVTVNGENCLHIAVKNNMLEAFEVLVRWLQRICHEDASKWKESIPRRKDLQGNTVPDSIAATAPKNRLQFVQLLAEIYAKDSEGNHKIITSSTVKNRRTSSSVQSGRTLTDYIRSKTSFDERLAVVITRYMMRISDDARNTLLVVLGLLVTATFPAIFNPPGSVRQDQDDDNNNSSNPITVINGTHCINTTASRKPSALPGTVVMDPRAFLFFIIYNSGILHAAICLTCFLLPDGYLGSISRFLLYYLSCCYILSILSISPDNRMVRIVVFLLLISMSAAVVLVTSIHHYGRKKLKKLRRLCYTSN